MFFKRNKLVTNDNHAASEPRAQSVIAADMVLEGNLLSKGELHIEGEVRGTIEADICVVGRDGIVEGTIRAGEVIVEGRVIGPIHANHVTLRDGADVKGDVVNTSIQVESGAHLQGAVWHSESPLGGTPPLSQPEPVRTSSYLGNPLWAGDEDAFRPLTDRVENFAKRYTSKVRVLDAASASLPGISAKTRGLISPIQPGHCTRPPRSAFRMCRGRSNTGQERLNSRPISHVQRQRGANEFSRGRSVIDTARPARARHRWRHRHRLGHGARLA